MIYTTAQILTLLHGEREFNMLVSNELLAETDEWIERFKVAPEALFELSGEKDLIVEILDLNKETIESIINASSPAATEEEAGSIEGFVFVNEEDEHAITAPEKKTGNEQPTFTISYDELYRMFSYMRDTVEGHTNEISALQNKIREYEATGYFPAAAIAAGQQPHAKETPLSIQQPAFDDKQELTTEQPVRPVPSFPEFPVFGNAAPEEPEDHHDDEEHIEELDTVFDDEFTDAPHNGKPAAEQKPKKKLDKQKKMILAGMMVVAMAGIGATLFMPPRKPAHKAENNQMQPPASLNAPAVAPQPVLKQMSTVKSTPAPQAPAPAPVKPEAVKAPEPTAPAQPEVKKEQVTFTYSDGVKVSVKANHNNAIVLSKGETVTDIEGKDTDNWTIDYKPKFDKVYIMAKGNNLKNTIKITTSKRTYTMNLTSTHDGLTRLDLR